MSNRNLALDADVAIVRRTLAAPVQKAPAAAAVCYGIEVLKPQGWVPLAGFFSRRIKQFSSVNEATDACIAYWQRSGRAARPFRVGNTA